MVLPGRQADGEREKTPRLYTCSSLMLPHACRPQEGKGREGCSFLQVASLFLGQRHNSPRRGVGSVRPFVCQFIMGERENICRGETGRFIPKSLTSGEGTLSHQRRVRVGYSKEPQIRGQGQKRGIKKVTKSGQKVAPILHHRSRSLWLGLGLIPQT